MPNGIGSRWLGLWTGATAFFFFLILPCFLPAGALSSGSPAPATPALNEYWGRLKSLPSSIPWEATGTLLYEAPGERYRLGFRLLGRDQRALRLELSDPFGRLIYYLVFYQGRAQALSLSDKKLVPLNTAALLDALPLPTGTRREDVFLLFWGRVPFASGETAAIRIQADRDPKRLHFLVNGEPPQVIRVEREPFRVLEVEIPGRGSSEPLQIFFSDFIELAESYWPKKIEVRGRDSEKKLTIQYEQIVPRVDIPDEAFLIADPK